MPHRVIRDGFIRSYSLQQVSRDARLTMALLILAVDDHGRMEASWAHLKADLFPLDDSVEGDQIWAWISELEREGCVEWYDVDDRVYLHLPNWDKHDSKRRKRVSELPEPPESGFRKVSETIENPTHGVGLGEGVKEREQDTGGGCKGEVAAPAALRVEDQECLAGCDRDPGHEERCAWRATDGECGWWVPFDSPPAAVASEPAAGEGVCPTCGRTGCKAYDPALGVPPDAYDCATAGEAPIETAPDGAALVDLVEAAGLTVGEAQLNAPGTVFVACEDCVTVPSCSEAFACGIAAATAKLDAGLKPEREPSWEGPCLTCQSVCDGPECVCACHGERARVCISGCELEPGHPGDACQGPLWDEELSCPAAHRTHPPHSICIAPAEGCHCDCEACANRPKGCVRQAGCKQPFAHFGDCDPKPPRKSKRTPFPEPFPEVDVQRLFRWGAAREPALTKREITHAIGVVGDSSLGGDIRRVDWVRCVQGAIRRGWGLEGCASKPDAHGDDPFARADAEQREAIDLKPAGEGQYEL